MTRGVRPNGAQKRRPAPQVARRNAAPGYWRNETSGVLKPAIEAYLERDELTPDEVSAIRAYLRQWIAGGFLDDAVEELRATVNGLTSRQAIDEWLHEALKVGIDPL
jgi:hypothetical protein